LIYKEIYITEAINVKGALVYQNRSLNTKSELILTIMASIAQEESRSISQNVTWGKRVAFKAGKVSFAYSMFLGYEKEDDRIIIVESEAKIVRRIYRMFLVEGLTPTGIARTLKKEGIKTPLGKNTNWTKNNITSILTNEKYKGDALLQKKFTVNFLENKMKVNEGEIPQYYVENNHPLIIDPIEWAEVQFEIRRREKLGRTYSSKNCFSSKLVCADCGGFYGQKVWHSTSKYRRVIWQCNKKFSDGTKRCTTPTLKEDDIKDAFLKAFIG